jgi:hypothetical protein
VSRGLAESSRQRSGRDDRSDPGHHDGDGGEHIARQLPQARRSSRVLNLHARRGIHLFGQQRIFVVIAADDGNLIVRDAARVQRARTGRRRRRIWKESQDERMRHST